MKRFFIALTMMLCMYLISSAQITGGFNIGQDGHIYFMCQNQSGYNLQVRVIAKSSDRTNSENQYMNNGGGLILGPTTPWRWYFKSGDLVQIVFPNGQYQSWSCPRSDVAYGNNPVFKGKKQSSCHIRGHNCSGGIDKNRDGWCDKCFSNGYKCHMANHQN